LRFHADLHPETTSPEVPQSLKASYNHFNKVRSNVQGNMSHANKAALHIAEPLRGLEPDQPPVYNLSVTYQEYVSLLAKRVEDKAMRRVAVPRGGVQPIEDNAGNRLKPRVGSAGARKRTEINLKVKHCDSKARVSSSWYTSTQFAPSNKPPNKKVTKFFIDS